MRKIKNNAELVEQELEFLLEEVKEEANEEVGNITVKRWQVVVGAAAITVLLLVAIL